MLLCAAAAAPEAALIEDLVVLPVTSLAQAADWLRGGEIARQAPAPPDPDPEAALDLVDVRGHIHEIAPSASSPHSSNERGRSAEAMIGVRGGSRNSVRAVTWSPSKSTLPSWSSARSTVRYSRSCCSGRRQCTP